MPAQLKSPAKICIPFAPPCFCMVSNAAVGSFLLLLCGTQWLVNVSFSHPYIFHINHGVELGCLHSVTFIRGELLMATTVRGLVSLRFSKKHR